MEGKRATEVLEAEHHVIQQMVGVLAALAEDLAAGSEPPAETLRGIVDFMRTYADKCHHGKEEAHLFPLLEARGIPARGCPVGVLVHEHERGRTLVGHLAETLAAHDRGEDGARDALVTSLRGLMDLYPGHIWKEEYLLFPMTNKVLSPADQQQLTERFEAVENAMGRDVHRRFEDLAEEFARSVQST